MSLSQTDLNVRLQLAGCKYSELANTYANNLKYGMKCAKVNLANLLLLNALIKTLECYTIPGDESGLIERSVNSGLTIGWTIELFADGVSISGVITITNTDPATLAQQVADTVNTYQDEIVASYSMNGRKNIVFSLVTPCNSPEIVLVVNTGQNVNRTILPYLRTGVCITDRNCFTEEQILALLDKISKLVNLCYQPIGFDYEIPEGYTLDEDGCLIPN